MPPSAPDPVSSFLGFSVQINDALPAGTAQFCDPRDGKVLATVVGVGSPTELEIKVAAPSGVRGELSEDPSATLGEARLYGVLAAIMRERGVHGAALAVARAMQKVTETARAEGRGAQGYIG